MGLSPVVSRTITILAIVLLAFDGAALAALGFMTGRMMLIAMGVVFLLSSGVIVIYWRWYRRRLEDISAARLALSEEARALRESVRGKGEEGRER